MKFNRIALFSLLLSSFVSANINIGKVTAIRGDVKITRGIALYQAHKNLYIEEKDTFFTTKHGSMQITFSDNTVVTLGKNTVFKVDEYLYNEKKRTKNKVKFKFRKGFFKSITGRIGKLAPKNFKIKTKNSTIGVRGTEITGTSNTKVEDIVCTHGEIVVKSGKSKKEYVAKANEHVKIKLDPRVDYIIAKPTDLLVTAQVEAGIKDKNDAGVKKHIVKEMAVVLKPKIKKALAKKGIKVDIRKPIVARDVVEAPVKIQRQETKKIENNFYLKDKAFKSQTELRKEIEVYTEKVKKGESESAIEVQPETEEERIQRETEAREFYQSETARVKKQQALLEKNQNRYRATLPKKFPEKKVTSKKESYTKTVNTMDKVLDTDDDL